MASTGRLGHRNRRMQHARVANTSDDAIDVNQAAVRAHDAIHVKENGGRHFGLLRQLLHRATKANMEILECLLEFLFLFGITHGRQNEALPVAHDFKRRIGGDSQQFQDRLVADKVPRASRERTADANQTSEGRYPPPPTELPDAGTFLCLDATDAHPVANNTKDRIQPLLGRYAGSFYLEPFM